MKSAVQTITVGGVGTSQFKTIIPLATAPNVQQIQVPGSKFHYVRLVTATTANSSTQSASQNPSTNTQPLQQGKCWCWCGVWTKFLILCLVFEDLSSYVIEIFKTARCIRVCGRFWKVLSSPATSGLYVEMLPCVKWFHRWAWIPAAFSVAFT